MNDASLAKSRLLALLDEGSFVELWSLVTDRATDFNKNPKQEASDGVITGYGLIEGSPVYVFSQNPASLGGSVGEMHARKIVELYELAMKCGAPVIGLLDSTGLRLREGQDALAALGSIASAMVRAGGIVPQIMGIFGNAGGGMAVLAGLADFVFQEEEKGRLFVNAPDTIPGNSADKVDNGSAAFQTKETPNVDFAGSEVEVYEKIRSLTAMLPSNNEDREKSFETADDPNRLVEEIENMAADAGLMLSHLADDGCFFELKSDYARHMVTGLIKLNGQLVGVYANRSAVYENGELKEEYDKALYPKGAEKAIRLIRFCDAFDIPILSIADITGFRTCMCGEKSHVEKTAGLLAAYASATVPKVVLITGNAISSASIAMGAKAVGADLVFAWKNAKLGPMEAGMAAKVLAQGAEGEKPDAAEVEESLLAAKNAAARGLVDMLIDPEETRKHLSYAFDILYSKVASPDKKHGTK